MHEEAEEAQRLIADLDPRRLRIAVQFLRILVGDEILRSRWVRPHSTAAESDFGAAAAATIAASSSEENWIELADCLTVGMVALLDVKIAAIDSEYQAAKVQTAKAFADTYRIEQQLLSIENKSSPSQDETAIRSNHQGTRAEDNRDEDITSVARDKREKAEKLKRHLSSLEATISRLNVRRLKFEFDARRIKIRSDGTTVDVRNFGFVKWLRCAHRAPCV